MSQNSYDSSPSLYLIPTPIGNMEDITMRAINTLKLVDVIFCEDTRVTHQLLKNYDIHKKLVANHKFNEEENKNKLLNYLNEGLNVGLVSDRGTPIINDPGYILAKTDIDNNYNVISLPGASAFLCALTSSGISPMPFLYYGFLNNKKSKRIKELENLKFYKETIIFYEAPHRLLDTLNDMKLILGNNRECSISREITKKHEEIIRGNLGNIISKIENVKGEFVIVLEGNQEKENYNEIDVSGHVNLYIEKGMKVMDAIKQVSKDRNMKKSEVYNLYHNIEKRNK